MLEKLGEKTYIINGHNKIGIYLINDKDIAVIDTGFNDKDGQKIMDVCNGNNWNIKMIFNTHSHIDHIGGNNIIQNKLNVPIYAKGLEKALIENPEITAAISFGGYPPKYFRNNYFMAKESKVFELTQDILPSGLEYLNLPGHNAEMVGFKTSDNIYFLADSVAGENIIKKYNIQFMYNVKDYFKTLDYIKKLEGNLFIPSHGDNFTDAKKIVKLNKDAAKEIIKALEKICKVEITFHQILKSIFEIYNLKMDIIQHAYIGATIKCYLSYLVDNDKMEIIIANNEMFWRTL